MRRGKANKRDARLIAAATGVSALGDSLLWIPLTLHLERTTGSGLAVAALMIALFAPSLVLAPLAGLIVDRYDARRVLIGVSLAQAAVVAALALALGSTAAVLALTVALGCGTAIARPAEFALVPAIARDASTAELSRLNGWIESARYSGMVAGPLAGGAIAAAGGTEIALAADAATFAAVALAGVALRVRRPGTAAGAGQDAGRARDGFTHLLGDRTLALVVGAAFVSLLFMSATITAEIFYIKEDLGAGDLTYGLLFSSWTVGMVAGAVAVAGRVRTGLVAVAALASIGLQGLGIGLSAAVVSAAFVGTMWFAGGLGHGVKNVLVRTLIQQRVPERVHGRAFAAYNGARNGAELVALAAGGTLVAVIGPRLTLVLAGAVPVVTAIAALAVYRARSPGPAADAPPVPASSPSAPERAWALTNGANPPGGGGASATAAVRSSSAAN